ncbi:glycoside hydrolase family 3 protein [Kocuria sp. JC486]|uniref:glycoside hydrolase family 3 protein n=1 Tax=Kocuria sp. JC486 TaxID=1970736 RepID=UPI0014245FDC|nr:glycoside hydrolase family 3 protein [Kocuria sp. JC486]NHU86120.1 glycoside hydrolase family 3 protein [Kocuria sp. JC486]
MRRNPISPSGLATTVLLTAGLFVLPSCASGGPGDGSSGAASASGDPTSTTSTTTGPWAVDAATQEAAEQAVRSMSVEEKAGQVIVASFDGSDAAAVDAQIQTIEDLHLGGVIVMGRNVPTTGGAGETQEDSALGGAQGVDVNAMTEQNARMQDALSSAHEGQDWPGIISVDQEGGTVTRLGAPLTQWPLTSDIGEANDPDLTREAAAGLASELSGLGFTMNNAPSADVTTPGDAVVLDRSYGSDPENVGEQAVASVEGHTDAGLVSSPKHFPGHGSVTTDSHVGLPVQEKSVEDLKTSDWVPFQAAVDAGAPTVMMGHIAVSEWDAKIPATLQSKAYDAVRNDLGFKGAVVTDALDMGALQGMVGPGKTIDTGVTTPAGAALQAGADLLLMPEDAAAAHADIVQAVESSAIPEDRLDEAATRVVALQMMQKKAAEDPEAPASEPGSHQELVTRIEEAQPAQ